MTDVGDAYYPSSLDGDKGTVPKGRYLNLSILSTKKIIPLTMVALL